MNTMDLGVGLGGTYLDNNATTQIDPKVIEAMEPYLRVYFGNASSQHGYGVPVERLLQERVSRLLILSVLSMMMKLFLHHVQQNQIILLYGQLCGHRMVKMRS